MLSSKRGGPGPSLHASQSSCWRRSQAGAQCGLERISGTGTQGRGLPAAPGTQGKGNKGPGTGVRGDGGLLLLGEKAV